MSIKERNSLSTDTDTDLEVEVYSNSRPANTPPLIRPALQPEYAIEFENVSRQYRLHHEPKMTLQDRVINLFKKESSYEDFWALKNINFKLEKGKTLGIIGKNGAGKSTLLKLATRILEPTSGTIRVNGRVSAMLELGTGFHPELSARENIFLNGAFYGFNRKQMEERYEQIVEFSELGKFIDTPVKHFSSGMYMRLGFAVAITVSPDILIIDEVLAVGDAAFGRKCHHAIEDLKRQSKAMLFVSHAAGEISRFCDDVIYLADGEIMGHGKPGDVLDDYMMDTVGPSYYVNTNLNQEDQDQTATESQPSSSLKGSAPPPARHSNIANEPVSLEENMLDFASLPALNTKITPQFWQSSYGLNINRAGWEFNLPVLPTAGLPFNQDSPELYLSVMNPLPEKLEFELSGYKQLAGLLDKAAGALKLFSMGHYQIEPYQILLLKLEDAALQHTRQLKLTAHQSFTAELVDYRPNPETFSTTAVMPVAPHHWWLFPYCDIRGDNVCRFEIFNPGGDFVDISLTLQRDWSGPLNSFRTYRCSPHSVQTIDLKAELAGGEGERHHGEGFYGGVSLESSAPVIIQRFHLQTISPDNHLKAQ